jgi:hypothetical protein
MSKLIHQIKLSAPGTLWFVPVAILFLSEAVDDLLILIVPVILITYFAFLYEPLLKFFLSPKRLEGVSFRGKDVWTFKSTENIWQIQSRKMIFLSEDYAKHATQLDELFMGQRKKDLAQLPLMFLSPIWIILLAVSSLYFLDLLWPIMKSLRLGASEALIAGGVFFCFGYTLVWKFFRRFLAAIPLSPLEPLNLIKLKSLFVANLTVFFLIGLCLLFLETQTHTVAGYIVAWNKPSVSKSFEKPRVGQSIAE